VVAEERARTAAIKTAWEVARRYEPAAPVAPGAVAALRAALDAMASASERPSDELPSGAAADLVAVYLRAAAIAIAAGDDAAAQAWLASAQDRARVPAQRALVAAAQAHPARFRMLIHARYQFGLDRERAARALCKVLLRGDRADAIAQAARDELAAPRPLRGEGPTLARLNGCGVGFYGQRDHDRDGSYTTTHCVSLLWVPLVPLAAYRVQPAPGGYHVLARMPLSTLARRARIGVLVAAVLAIAGFGVHHHLTDPARLARQRFDAAVAAADGGDREAALARLDRELTGPDLAWVDTARAERAGAAVIELTAALAPSPLTAADVDQALRVVDRYRALPHAAAGGAARAAIDGAIDRWIADLRDGAAALPLVRVGAALAHDAGDVARAMSLDARADALRLGLAEALAVSEPTEALDLAMAPPRSSAATAAAGRILARLAAQPSLLDDAPAAVEAWLAAAAPDDPTRAAVLAARARADAARPETEAEDLTSAALAAMARSRPWDQRVAMALARADADAGDAAAGVVRLRRFGDDGRLMRGGRLLLAQLEAERGQLEVADGVLTALLAQRLPRYVAANGALDAAGRAVSQRLEALLDAGAIPAELRARLEAPGATDAAREDAVREWMTAALRADAEIAAAQAATAALDDVVAGALALGMIKLRRAQAADAAARDALLAEAERAFVAIRGAAEGQPVFHLAMGEIYARLGKVEASEAEFATILNQGDPQLTLEVARLYRNLGSTARATEVATKLFGSAPAAVRSEAAVLLGLLTEADEATSERWYREADPASLFARNALLELDARRAMREGQWQRCATLFAQSAKASLEHASAVNSAGYNNAATAYMRAFGCSADVAWLDKAEAAMTRAHQLTPADPIVVGNLVAVLRNRATVRALGRRVDVAALGLDSATARAVVSTLLDRDTAAVIGAELAADRAWVRARALAAQVVVLAPNNPDAYELGFEDAAVRRDVVAATALIEQLRRARALDTSAAADARRRAQSAADDAQDRAALGAYRDRLSAALARRDLDDRTRAVGHLVRGVVQSRLAVIDGAAATADACGQDLAEAARRWPALDVAHGALACAIDAIVLADRDAERWRQDRRATDAIGALAALRAAGDPRWQRYQQAAGWSALAAQAATARARPSITDMHLARLFPGAAQEARAMEAHDDPMVRLTAELAARRDPGDALLAADLALFH